MSKVHKFYVIATFLAHGYDQKFIMAWIHQKWTPYEHTLPGNDSLFTFIRTSSFLLHYLCLENDKQK